MSDYLDDDDMGVDSGDDESGVYCIAWQLSDQSDYSDFIDSMYFSSQDYDVYIIKDGVEKNYIQCDYPIVKIDLYAIPDGVTVESYDDIFDKCTLVQSLEESDTEYEIQGSFNIIIIWVYSDTALDPSLVSASTIKGLG